MKFVFIYIVEKQLLFWLQSMNRNSSCSLYSNNLFLYLYDSELYILKCCLHQCLTNSVFVWHACSYLLLSSSVCLRFLQNWIHSNWQVAHIPNVRLMRWARGHRWSSPKPQGLSGAWWSYKKRWTGREMSDRTEHSSGSVGLLS